MSRSFIQKNMLWAGGLAAALFLGGFLWWYFPPASVRAVPRLPQWARAQLSDGHSVTVVGLGDSTTAGVTGTNEFTGELLVFPYTFIVQEQHPDWTVINSGKSGERTDQMLGRFHAEVLAHHPDFVVVWGGQNDFNLLPRRGVKGVFAYLKEIYILAEYHRIVPVIVTTNIFPEASMGVRLRILVLQYAQKRFARRHNLPLISVPNISSDDGIHPDAEMYRRVGLAVSELIRGLLSTTGRGVQ